ncbi:cytochrome P450 [Thermocatellispora tengchongensis]|uniref:Cytochrome P450 n=1 Tax=Thermocatellispora tengchongensis TaxID=1073253 RepID=A0A840PC88_9ACTN|nr:cytochrome P450 [Thermocatellispora tengchongensis]MBB5133635.1 cytochrome P450 [Thermocatellispora tengchongensis]
MREGPLTAPPRDRYAALREAGPIHRAGPGPGPAGWLVVGYDLAREALAHPGLVPAPPGSPETPSRHSRLRDLVAGVMTPQRGQWLAPRVRRIAVELLDAMRGLREVDLVLGYTAPLPVLSLCELLGVPQERRADYRRWSFQAFGVPSGSPEALARLRDQLADLIADKRRRPGDDLLSGLLAAEVSETGEAGEAGERVGEEELLDVALSISAAGHLYLAGVLTDAVAALLRHPDQVARLFRRPELLPGAVEEVLRYALPAELAPVRFAAEDLVLGGVRVCRGEAVTIALSSAGRDAPVLGGKDPGIFDLTRVLARHLAFGHGAHACPAASVVRLTLSIALITLFTRYPALSPAGPLDGCTGCGRPRLRVRLLRDRLPDEAPDERHAC